MYTPGETRPFKGPDGESHEEAVERLLKAWKLEQDEYKKLRTPLETKVMVQRMIHREAEYIGVMDMLMSRIEGVITRRDNE